MRVARDVEGVPDGAAPRALETRVVRGTRATYLDRGTVGEVGVRHAELDDVRAGLVQDRERLLGGVEVGIARADEGHERALVAPLQGSEGLADGRGGRGVSAAARANGAARAVRRIATAERVASLTPARGEAAKAVAAIVVPSEDDRRGCGVGEGLELQGRAWADVTCGAVPVCGRLCCPRRRSRRARRAISRGFDAATARRIKT